MTMTGLLALQTPALASPAETSQPYVRLAELEVDPSQMEQFKAASLAHVEAATRDETGLLALHVTAETVRPTQVRVFEMYVNAEAYRAHLATPHFKRFVEATEKMIRARQLFDAVPLRVASKPLASAHLQVRVADLQIAPGQLKAYTAAVTEEIDAYMQVEPGVRAIYAVALAKDPGAMRFFEIYEDEAAYRSHIASPHFRKYVDATKEMILARELHLTAPIALQAKPSFVNP